MATKYTLIASSPAEVGNTCYRWQQDGWRLHSWHPHGMEVMMLFRRDEEPAGVPTVGIEIKQRSLRDKLIHFGQAASEYDILALTPSEARLLFDALHALELTPDSGRQFPMWWKSVQAILAAVKGGA